MELLLLAIVKSHDDFLSREHEYKLMCKTRRTCQPTSPTSVPIHFAATSQLLNLTHVLEDKKEEE